MAKQTNQYLPVGFRNESVKFDASDTTATKAIFAAGANDSKIGQLTIANTTASIVKFYIYLYDGATDSLLTTVSVPALAGKDGSAVAFDVLGLAFVKNYIIPLEAGWSLRAAAVATLGGDALFNIVSAEY
jgi:hypothetical protein